MPLHLWTCVSLWCWHQQPSLRRLLRQCSSCTVPLRLNASLLLPTGRGLLQFNDSASGASVQLPSDVQAACASSALCANNTQLNLQVSKLLCCAAAAAYVPSGHACAGSCTKYAGFLVSSLWRLWLLPMQVSYYSDSSALTSYLVAQFGTDWLGIGSTQETIGEVLMLTYLRATVLAGSTAGWLAGDLQ